MPAMVVAVDVCLAVELGAAKRSSTIVGGMVAAIVVRMAVVSAMVPRCAFVEILLGVKALAVWRVFGSMFWGTLH